MKYPKDATRLDLIGSIPDALDFFTILPSGEERIVNASLVLDKLSALGLVKSSSNATLKKLTLAPDDVTGLDATSSLSIIQTWNTTGAPSALLVNVTDIASDAASNLLDLQVGGNFMFRVNKDGTLRSRHPATGALWTIRNVSDTANMFVMGDFSGSGFWMQLIRDTAAIQFGLNGDLTIQRGGPSIVKLGYDHATTATAQTIKAHDVAIGVGADLNLAGGTGSSAKGRVRFITAMGLPALTFAEASENPSQYNFVMITDSADMPLVDSIISSGGGGPYGCLCVVNANGEFVMISGTDFNFVPS